MQCQSYGNQNTHIFPFPTSYLKLGQAWTGSAQFVLSSDWLRQPEERKHPLLVLMPARVNYFVRMGFPMQYNVLKSLSRSCPGAESKIRAKRTHCHTVLAGYLDELLGQAVEEPSSKGQVLETVAEREGDAVNHHQAHLSGDTAQPCSTNHCGGESD